MARIRFLAALVCCSLLASCAIGPDYKRPKDLQAAPDWKFKDDQTPPLRGTYSNWWVVFGDPNLNRLEMAALNQNQEMRVAVANVLEARAKARVSQSAFFPSITANPNARWYQNSEESTLGKTNALQGIGRDTLESYSMPLDLSYEVDIWGKVRRHFEGARALAQASQEAYRVIFLTMTSDVAANYYTLRTLDSERKIFEQEIKLRQDSLDVIAARYHAGLISEIDVNRAEVELANAESDLAQSIERRAQIENALAVLTGVSASAFQLEEASFTNAAKPPSIPPGLPSDLLKRRPDVSQAEAILISENAEIGVAKANFFPVLRLTGTAGFESSDLSNLFVWSGRTWSFGPSVTLPIFEGGRNLANYHAQKARFYGAQAQYRQKILVAFREVEDALISLRQQSVQSAAQMRARAAAERAVTLARLRYDKGITNYFEVIDAERSLLQAKRSVNGLMGRQFSSTIQLIKALGGGWENTNFTTPIVSIGNTSGQAKSPSW